MPAIDVAFQNLLTARAIHTKKKKAGDSTWDVLDWSGIVVGTRTAAGLDPFDKGRVRVFFQNYPVIQNADGLSGHRSYNLR